MKPFHASDGSQIAYTVNYSNNPKPGFPVILVCGLSSVKEDWLEVPGHLLNNRHVARLDNRGIGESYLTTRNRKFSLTDMASDVSDLMDFLKWEKAHVWGHSMGGFISQLVAQMFPEKVVSVVLLGTASGVPVVKQPKVDLGRVFLESASLPREEAARKFWEVNLTPEWVAQNAEKAKHLEKTLGTLHRPAKGIMMQMQAIGKWKNKPETIKCPALVIHGDQDLIMDVECGRHLARVIPRAEYLEMPTQGHAPQFMDGTEDMIKAVSDFYDRVERSHSSDRSSKL